MPRSGTRQGCAVGCWLCDPWPGQKTLNPCHSWANGEMPNGRTFLCAGRPDALAPNTPLLCFQACTGVLLLGGGQLVECCLTGILAWLCRSSSLPYCQVSCLSPLCDSPRSCTKGPGSRRPCLLFQSSVCVLWPPASSSGHSQIQVFLIMFYLLLV